MVELVSWNIAKRRNAWRELCKMDVDVALLQEAGNVPDDVSEFVYDGPRASWDPQVWNADYGNRWSSGLSERWCKIVKLSDRVEVKWFKQVSPISMPSKDEVAVSGIGTIAVARIIPEDGLPFIAVSMWARWMLPHTSTNSKWRIGMPDVSAHRIIIVTFKGVAELAQDFVTADQFYPQRLKVDEGIVIEEEQFYSEPLYIGDGLEKTHPPSHVTEDGLYCYKAPFRLLGGTKTSEGIDLALDEIEKRKQMYRDNGIDYFRPWLFLITDGEPTEHQEVVNDMSRRLKDADSQKRVAAFSVGVEGANMDMLARISPRRPLMLKGLDFSSMFVWLSQSMSRVSRSRTDDEITLDVEGLHDWAAI